MVYRLRMVFQNKNDPTYQDTLGAKLNNFQGSNLFWFKGSTHIGFSTDFKIEFQKFELFDITVADSIKILQEQYQAEKQKKIESAQQSITHWEDAIEKQRQKGDGLVAKTLTSRYQKDLEKAKAELEEAKQWEVDYTNRYDGRSGTEILTKKADTYFSFQNPKLAQPVRQEMGAYFVLSPDGSKCYKMVKQANQ